MSATSPILNYVFNPETVTPIVAENASVDSFDTYSVGAITSLTGFISSGDTTLISGFFALTPVEASPASAWDSFDTYANGAIVTLTDSDKTGSIQLLTGLFVSRVENHDADSFDGYADGAITALGPGDSQDGDVVVSHGYFV